VVRRLVLLGVRLPCRAAQAQYCSYL
jgi:hypothetical protein